MVDRRRSPAGPRRLRSPTTVWTRPAAGPIGDNQTSSLDTTVTGPATLSFWWKVDSEPNFDFLTVTSTGPRRSPVSPATSTGNRRPLRCPPVPHTIHWTYTKDGSVSVGQNAAWLDQVTVGPPQAPLTLADAVDNPGVALTTTGDLPWTAQTGVTHDGVDAARSGAIGDNQTSSLEYDRDRAGHVVVLVEGRLRAELRLPHRRRRRGRAVPRYLRQRRLATEDHCAACRCRTRSAGPTRKDGSVSVGQNAAWLDQMTIAPG